MGFGGFSSGAGRLPGSVARPRLVWVRLGWAGFRVSPPRPGLSLSLCLAWVSGNLPRSWAKRGVRPRPGALPGNLPRTWAPHLGGRFRVTPPAGARISRGRPGLRGRRRYPQGRRAPARRRVRAAGPGPRPGLAGRAVSWFFPGPVQKNCSEIRGAHQSPPGRVQRPGRAPGSVRRARRRGPAVGFRVTQPKNGETARWRPPSRAGAVWGRRCRSGVGGAGPEAARGGGFFGQRSPGQLPGNLRQAWGGTAWAGFRVTWPAGLSRRGGQPTGRRTARRGRPSAGNTPRGVPAAWGGLPRP